MTVKYAVRYRTYTTLRIHVAMFMSSFERAMLVASLSPYAEILEEWEEQA